MRSRLTNCLYSFSRTLLVFLVLLVSSCDWNDSDFKYIDHKIENNKIIINATVGKIEFVALEGEAIEVYYLKNESDEHPSFAKKEGIETNVFDIDENEKTLSLSHGQLKAVINKLNLSGQLLISSSLIYQNIFY